MHVLSAFVIAAAACALLLTGCGSGADSTSTLDMPDSSRLEQNPVQTSPAPADAATSTPAPSPEVFPPAEPTATPVPESDPDTETILFDTDSAAYSGPVTEMTDAGFCMSLMVVEDRGDGAGVAVMAEAGTSSALPVICTGDTRYIAIYADGNGSSSQEEGSADMVRKDAFVFVTGSSTDDGFTADAVAVLNP